MKKEVKQPTPKENLNFTILDLLSKGLMPSQIAKRLGVSKSAISYYTSKLKASGHIEKIGYGVWKTTKKEVKDKGGYGSKIRGHAFRFKITFNNPKSWNQTRKYILKKIPNSRDLSSIGSIGVRIKKRKVWISKNNTIHIFFRQGESIFNSSARLCYNEAVLRLISILRRLESILSVNLKTGGKYVFEVKKQHYAFINSPVAKSYKKLGINFIEFRDKKGELWALIDNSFNLDEFETIHPKTAIKDNSKMSLLFNSQKEMPMSTYQFHSLAHSVQGLVQNQEYYAKNLESHIKAIQDMARILRKMEARLNGNHPTDTRVRRKGLHRSPREPNKLHYQPMEKKQIY